MEIPTLLLAQLVNINSWSHNHDGIQLCNEAIVKAIRHLPGLTHEYLSKPDKPNLLIIRNHHSAGQPNVLLLGHIDTVHPPDKHKGYEVGGEKATGDGVEDMKGGVFVMLNLMADLQDSPVNLTCVINIDEEIGSTAYLEELSRIYSEQDLALVFEGGELEGDRRRLISRRKGIVAYDVTTVGKAGHSGVLTDPKDRLSSNLEMVYKLYEIQRLEEQFESVSINIGRLEGGQSFNIVSEETKANFEVRSFSSNEMQEVLSRVTVILGKEFRKGVKTTASKLFNFMPLTTDREQEEKLTVLQSKLQNEGVSITYGERGGVSDANKVRESNPKAIVLDALGPVGGGSHTKEEWININSLQESIDLADKIIDNYIKA